MNINNKCVLKKGTHRGKLYAVLIIEAREHSTAKNHSRAPGEARGVGGGGLLVAVTSFCGGVSGMFSEIFVT